MSLLRLFDAIVDAQPDAPALVSSRGSITYRVLRARSDAVARALVSAGVQPSTAIGLAVPRSVEAVIGVLATLRAGCAYVPIDPAYPAERQRFIADNAELAALLVHAAQAEVPAWATRLPVVDIGATAVTFEPWLPAPTTPQSALLNLLYTSGSTGRPKGVRGTHGAMLNRLRWAWEALPLQPDDVIGHRSSLNFVDAGPELFTGLLRGAPTAVILPEEQANLARLLSALNTHQVTRLTVVPSILAALVRSTPALGAALPRLLTWVTSGEELTQPLLEAARAAHPDATVVNLYGTTEVTGDVTCAIFRPGEPLPTERVPIGAAIAGAELFILDSSGGAVAEGEVGELYVGGPVLADGYHRSPQEEALRFWRHPTRPDARIFWTGDLVRRRTDGTLDYLGRVDNLVKLRGIRIELEEVERALTRACPEVDDVVVVVDGDTLVAAVTPTGTDADAVRASAAQHLPSAMVPGRIVPMASMPRLPNGKCDRKALLGQLKRGRREIDAERAPCTPTERGVAAIWARLLGRDDLARDDTFAALGGTSLGLAELMLALEAVPSAARVEFGLARDGTLEQVARALDGHAEVAAAAHRAITLTPLSAEGDVPSDVVDLLVEASHDAVLIASTELPLRLDAAAARAHALASDGIVIRVDGIPVGAGFVQHHPCVGDGVEVPSGAVQLDEWLLARWRGSGILSEGGAWPLLADWLAQRFDTEVSVTWEDHAGMIAILRARGYHRVGRSYWTSPAGGEGTAGYCEVWTYDLRPHRQ